MKKTRYLKRKNTFDVLKYIKRSMASAGIVTAAPERRHSSVGAVPPQTPSEDVKKKLAAMPADMEVLSRVSAYTASCKVKKKNGI